MAMARTAQKTPLPTVLASFRLWVMSCHNILNQMTVKYIRITDNQSIQYFALKTLMQQLWEPTAHSANKQTEKKERITYTYIYGMIQLNSVELILNYLRASLRNQRPITQWEWVKKDTKHTQTEYNNRTFYITIIIYNFLTNLELGKIIVLFITGFRYSDISRIYYALKSLIYIYKIWYSYSKARDFRCSIKSSIMYSFILVRPRLGYLCIVSRPTFLLVFVRVSASWLGFQTREIS
jgi:hypothetical protein